MLPVVAAVVHEPGRQGAQEADDEDLDGPVGQGQGQGNCPHGLRELAGAYQAGADSPEVQRGAGEAGPPGEHPRGGARGAAGQQVPEGAEGARAAPQGQNGQHRDAHREVGQGRQKGDNIDGVPRLAEAVEEGVLQEGHAASAQQVGFGLRQGLVEKLLRLVAHLEQAARAHPRVDGAGGGAEKAGEGASRYAKGPWRAQQIISGHAGEKEDGGQGRCRQCPQKVGDGQQERLDEERLHGLGTGRLQGEGPGAQDPVGAHGLGSLLGGRREGRQAPRLPELEGARRHREEEPGAGAATGGCRREDAGLHGGDAGAARRPREWSAELPGHAQGEGAAGCAKRRDEVHPRRQEGHPCLGGQDVAPLHGYVQRQGARQDCGEGRAGPLHRR
mmetsp:Transcript_87265/g.267086  ORF Transcript_87265/g.267086 Transcript_87265/m.267086 type:complete len:388 (-) Transcript_87265:984-2147(-)